MRKQTSTQENQVPLTSQPQGHGASVRAGEQRSLGTQIPSLKNSEPEDALMDPALDALLARAHTPALRTGFADRVIQSVQPTSPSTSHLAALWISGLAAALALCTGTLLWRMSPAQTEAPNAASNDEERLVAALRSPDLSGEDLAIVANLGEVLEAELIANHPLWLDEK